MDGGRSPASEAIDYGENARTESALGVRAYAGGRRCPARASRRYRHRHKGVADGEHQLEVRSLTACQNAENQI